MDKSGANGSEAAASGATAAAGSTDWQKGNPQLSALLSQQAVSGGGAVVINGAAANAAGAVVSKFVCPDSGSCDSLKFIRDESKWALPRLREIYRVNET